MSDRYFEDFLPGFTFTTDSQTVTEEDIIAFARQFDAQPYHLDLEGGRKSVFGSIVAGGFHTAALTWGLVIRKDVFGPCNLAGLGAEGLKWHKPMLPGDTVHVRGTVKAARPMVRRPSCGVLTTHYELINQRQEVIFTMDLLTMLARRPEDAARAGDAPRVKRLDEGTPARDRRR